MRHLKWGATLAGLLLLAGCGHDTSDAFDEPARPGMYVLTDTDILYGSPRPDADYEPVEEGTAVRVIEWRKGEVLGTAYYEVEVGGETGYIHANGVNWKPVD